MATKTVKAPKQTPALKKALSRVANLTSKKAKLMGDLTSCRKELAEAMAAAKG